MITSRDLKRAYAYGGGLGLMPFAPGTWGTLGGYLIYALLISVTQRFYLIPWFGLFYLGILASEMMIETLGADDDPSIVCDEACAYALVLYLMPFSWPNIILSFALFRLFDIWKPWPIRSFEQQARGGFAIMFDDILAGAYTLLVLWGFFALYLLLYPA